MYLFVHVGVQLFLSTQRSDLSCSEIVVEKEYICAVRVASYHASPYVELMGWRSPCVAQAGLPVPAQHLIIWNKYMTVQWKR